jgi:hypothetical protein
MLEVGRICLQLALDDLLPLSPTHRPRALHELQSIDPRLVERLRLELAFALG